MGYQTEFSGAVEVNPPLNQAERDYLKKFAESRRMDRENGPYFVDGSGEFGQGDGPDEIYDYNSPPAGQPGLWCQWEPSEEGDRIEWDQGEKFYNAADWMEYIIHHFLKPGATASTKRRLVDDNQFKDFTFDHVVNGEIDAQGEESGDTWKLVVEDNDVKVKRPTITWED